MACTTKSLYKSLEYCAGKPNLPGIKSRLYYIQKSKIASFPTLPEVAATGQTPDKLVTYVGKFTLAADAKWLFIDVLVNESPVTSETQGEVPSASFINKATFKHPGREEDATAFAMQAINDDFVYLVQQKNGKFRVIGNDMCETITKVKQELGGAITDKAGTTIEVEVSDICPAPFYTGEIVAEAGTINEANPA